MIFWTVNIFSQTRPKTLPPFQEPAFAPSPSPSTNISAVGSGRNFMQRKAALFAVNAELERKPYILPKKENAPTKNDMLQIAQNRSKTAHQKFDPDDLFAFSKVVTWIPRFDGLYPDTAKAKKLSLLVSSTTNYLNKPYFFLALASAVFSLDPIRTANANNFASAIIAAGERLNPAPAKVEALVSYRKNAESGFLYAMAISMKNDAWTDESLTAILNLGNLYIDMGKLEEACSLFRVARKLNPFSWDAALGMAAYFHAIGKPDKALAIVEDDDLDKPVIQSIAVKAKKSLDKSSSFADVPIESPDNVYEEGINIMTSEPILTSADFIAQIDQSSRNKMRYFIENLPQKGSFTAPSIKELTQYASLQVITRPPGISAVKNFETKIGLFRITSSASSADQQLKTAARMGLKIDPGFDINDLAKHPEKYMNSKFKPNAKISGMEEYKANIQKLSKQMADSARKAQATGKYTPMLAMAAQVDPFFNVLLIDPEKYADPMNVYIQQYNFVVLNRKTNLYNGYLYSVNKRTYRAVLDEVKKYQDKIAALIEMRKIELEKFEKQKAEATAQHIDTETADWKLKKHAIHSDYSKLLNNVAETGFGSATNVASVAYTQRIKPMAESYYYDVLRHIALISDPDVRDQKEFALRTSVNQALIQALADVSIAYGSFAYIDEFDCDCNIEDLLRQREGEQLARNAEDKEQILRNYKAKVRFDSGEIPESSPLFKRLDAYFDEYNFGFVKVRVSCARTIVTVNTDILPIPGIPKLFGSLTKSEFTDATTYTGGIKVGIEAKVGEAKVGAYFGLSGSVSTDGQGVVKDYSVTPSVGLSVKAGNTEVTVGGELTFGPNGVKDSDFSAGISRDLSNGLGGEGNVSIEASTKRGCSLSGKVAQDISIKPEIDKNNGSKFKGEDNTEDKFVKKEVWSGQYKL